MLLGTEHTNYWSKTVVGVKEPTGLLLSKSLFEISSKGREKKPATQTFAGQLGEKKIIVLLFQPQNLCFFCVLIMEGFWK